jgi:hypothetical protein
MSSRAAFLRSSLNEAVATLRKSKGLPAVVQKTRSLSSHKSPSLSRSAFYAVHQADGAGREAGVELGLVEVLHVVGARFLSFLCPRTGLRIEAHHESA